MKREAPYLYPPPRVMIAPGKMIPITELPEKEQALLEKQILAVSVIAKIDFCEDDEWCV